MLEFFSFTFLLSLQLDNTHGDCSSYSDPDITFECESDGCCIYGMWQNDGICDCPQCEDEESWSCDTCGNVDGYTCENTFTNAECNLNIWLECDYKNTPNPTLPPTDRPQCSEDEFQCDRGCCLDMSWYDDGFCDCEYVINIFA